MKHGSTWASRCVGGLAALVALTHCGGPEAGEQAAEVREPQAPRTLQQAVATVVSFPASMDARVEAASPTRNFGGESKLVADASPERESYLRFNVSGVTGTVTRAVLRLYALDGTSDGPQLYLTGGGWTEAGLTWSNRPLPDSSVLDDLEAISSDSWVEYDLTGVVRGSHQYDFALVSRSGNGADFASREYSRAELRPQLVLTVESAPDCMPRTDTQVIDLPATYDGYASQSQPTRRFGSAPELLVDAAPARLETFLQFRYTLPPEWHVRGAKLRLHATDYTPDGPLLYRASDDWPATDFDWYSRPVLLGSPLGDLGVVDVGTWAEYDVSGVVTGDGVYSFGLLPESTNGVDFVSGDASAYELRPRLLLTVESEPYCTYQGTGGGLTGWTRHYGGAGPERLHALASDAQGGFVAAGLFGSAPFPNGTGFSLARYTSEGLPMWTRQVTTERVWVRAITVTPVGNILVVGNYGGSPDLGTGPLPTAPAGNDSALFIAKFSPSGQTEWARGFIATYVRPPEGTLEYWPVLPRAVATDANGSLIVAGSFFGQMDFGGGPLFAGADSVYSEGAVPGGFIAKFSWDGRQLWSRAFAAGAFSLPAEVRAVSTDGEGSVFVGGAVNSNSDLGDGRPIGTYGPFIAKYSASGALLWKRIWSAVHGEVVGVQPLGTTDVAFVGNFGGDFTFGGAPYSGGDPGDVPEPDNVTGFLGALSTWGADEWLRPLGLTRVRDLVTASDQSITFTGYGYEYDLGGGPLGTESFFGPTPFVARHTASGMHVWSRAFDRSLSVSGFRPMLLLAQQPGGSVVVGGDFIEPVRLDGLTYTPRGASDLLYFQLQP